MQSSISITAAPILHYVSHCRHSGIDQGRRSIFVKGHPIPSIPSIPVGLPSPIESVPNTSRACSHLMRTCLTSSTLLLYDLGDEPLNRSHHLSLRGLSSLCFVSVHFYPSIVNALEAARSHFVHIADTAQNQSPVEEQPNPYELSLTRSTSSGKASNHAGHARTGSNGPPSSVDTTNSLHRQLSGDPENPPPAWQRRPSVSTQRSGRGRSPSYTSSISATIHSQTSPIAETPKGTPSTRRHKGLAMTSVQDQSEESPVGMALADDPTLMLPQPAFRRRNGGSSSRSSIASSQDLSSLTSEELWNLDHEGKAGPIADMSNPMRNSAERPLDTVRRMSTRLEKTYQGGLPGEVICELTRVDIADISGPAVPAEEAYTPPTMSRSVTSMSSLKNGSKRMSRSRKNSRQSVIEIPATTSKAAVISQSTPVSPVGGQDQVFVHSTNSSSTSLASHNLHGKNKSTLSLNNGAKPPSTYYSRDFLSTLAPREGGYAIAAMLGNGLGAQGNLAVAEEKRRSSTMLYDPALGLPRNRSSMSMSRAPMSKSSGMGRWSLDGGEVSHSLVHPILTE